MLKSAWVVHSFLYQHKKMGAELALLVVGGLGWGQLIQVRRWD
jgi:hypothetical protein